MRLDQGRLGGVERADARSRGDEPRVDGILAAGHGFPACTAAWRAIAVVRSCARSPPMASSGAAGCPDRPRPICIRHEASPTVTASAPVVGWSPPPERRQQHPSRRPHGLPPLPQMRGESRGSRQPVPNSDEGRALQRGSCRRRRRSSPRGRALISRSFSSAPTARHTFVVSATGRVCNGRPPIGELRGPGSTTIPMIPPTPCSGREDRGLADYRRVLL